MCGNKGQSESEGKGWAVSDDFSYDRIGWIKGRRNVREEDGGKKRLQRGEISNQNQYLEKKDTHLVLMRRRRSRSTRVQEKASNSQLG